MKTGQTVKYVRVSSISQNVARQLDDTMTIDRTFIDKCSGSTTDRPALAEMIKFVREGDTVVVHEISRLARNTADLLELVKQLTDKGVIVKFIKEGLIFTGDKTNPIAQMMLTMLGAVSAFELSLISERRAEGVAKAQAAGKHCGRVAKLTADQITTIRQRAANESKVALAAEFGVSRATLYSVLKAA